MSPFLNFLPRRRAAPLRHPPARRAGQRGFALIISLLMLVVVSLLAVAMYRGMGLDEKIAGNTLEKQRSLQAADSALRYGEWWVSQGSAGAGGAGTGILCPAANVSGNTLTSMRTCSTALTNPATLPWTQGAITYQPPGMAVNASGGLVSPTSPGSDVNYVSVPMLYISYLGVGPDGASLMYQITSTASGGSAATASVLQSTYAMTPAVKRLDQP